MNRDHHRGDGSSTTDLLQERLQAAQILVRSTGADRVRGLEILKGLMAEAKGTQLALVALAELQRLGDHDEPPVVSDEEKQLELEWASIRGSGPMDGRLGVFLRRLHETPQGTARLVGRALTTLGRWLEEEAQRLEATRSRPASDASAFRRSQAFPRLLDVLGELPNFTAAITAEIGRYRDAAFGVRLVDLGHTVEQACRSWEIDRAGEVLRSLGPVPATHLDQVRRLEALIDTADTARSTTVAMLDRRPPEPPSVWSDVRLVRDWIVEARRVRDRHRPPEPWATTLDRAIEESLAMVRESMVLRSGAARSLEDVRSFVAQVQRLGLAEVDEQLAETPEWYEPVLADLAEALTQEVVAAAGAGELGAIADRYDADLWGIPGSVRARVLLWVEQLTRLRDGWVAMLRGDEFPDPNACSLALPAMVPAVFQALAQRYREHLDTLGEAQRQMLMRSGEADAAAAIDAALRTAEAVLSEVPGHVQARQLADEARRRGRTLDLDACLGRWDVEGFLSRAQALDPEPLWQQLLDAADALVHLAGLAQEEPLRSVAEAASWQRRWLSWADKLPAFRPPGLTRAMDQQLRHRQVQWRTAIERLLDSDPQPDACREARQHLAGWAEGSVLKPYVARLERAERIGRSAASLAAGDFQQALDHLAPLRRDDPEVWPLRTRLEVARAREEGPRQLAAVFLSHWSDAAAELGSEAYALLAEALAQSWSAGDDHALEQLCTVARRACRDREAPAKPREEMEGWLEWIALEQMLSNGHDASAIGQLIDHCQANADGRWLRQRIDALVKRWRRQGDTVALAWAFQTFAYLQPPLFPDGADPADELAAGSEKVAAELAEDIDRRDDLTRQDLEQMLRRLQVHEQMWGDLDDYLGLSPCEVTRARMPELLKEQSSRLARLAQAWTDVEELEHADLRTKESRSRWQATTLLLKLEHAGTPAATGLLHRLERLEPLCHLSFLESRLEVAARCCGSSTEEDAERPEVFSSVAAYLRKIGSELEAAHQTEGTMARRVLAEYLEQLPRLAGVLTRVVADDLEQLAALFNDLEHEENTFRSAIDELKAQQPWVAGEAGGFDPEAHLDYLAIYPGSRPRTRRVWRIFHRFARTAPQTAILKNSAGRLPDWIREYLEQGAP